MKLLNHSITVLFFVSIIFPAKSQIVDKEVINPISALTREQIENTGRTNIDAILAAVPMGKGGENFSYGFGINGQRNFGRSMVIIDGQPLDGGGSRFSITKSEVEKYGNIGPALDDIKEIQIIKSGFTAEFGGVHYLGKSETVGNYTYEYDGVTILHGFGGYRGMFCERADFQFEAGPAFAIFPNGNEFGFGASIGGYYNFTHPAQRVYNIITGTKKAELSVGVSLDFYKLNEVDAIIAPTAKLNFRF